MANRAKGVKKLFVLDTNVLLHDHECIYNFQENDIAIPIVALEELDRFKKGTETLNYHAREFARELDGLSDGTLFGEGVELGPGLGKLTVEPGCPFPEKMRQSFGEVTADHRILAIAASLQERHPERPVILVTKDINLRLKAKALDIEAEDYLTDKVVNIEALDNPPQVLTDVPEEVLSQLYSEGAADLEQLNGAQLPLAPNDCVELRATNGATAIAVRDSVSRAIRVVEKTQQFGIMPRNSEQAFAFQLLGDARIPLILLTGKAGTGKTLLALASALAHEEEYEQILLARPIVSLGNRDLGFLPGSVDEKISPYMQPLFDNLGVIRGALKGGRLSSRLDEIQRSNKLQISPLAYIRGRSLARTFMIVDEAQNLTPLEVKTIITRAGEGTKMVFTGDIYQIDHPYLDMRSNGVSYLYERMHGQSIFGHVNLTKGERSALAELASQLL